MTAPHAVISGGSSGIGLALARRLCSEGWSLTLLARNRERLERARDELEALCSEPAQRVLIFSADVSDLEQIAAAAQTAQAQLGAPRLLISSAGIAVPGYFRSLPVEVHRQTMEVDYFGTLHLVRALLPGMQAAGEGRIVLISSGAGLVGVFGYSAYSPAKFAVRGLGEVLRAELRPHGIGVSVVYPPDTDTPQLHEENKVKPAETFAISGNAKVWSAEEVASCILNGVRRGRFSITPGWELTLLARLNCLIQPLLHRVFDWQTDRAAQRSGDTKGHL